MKDFKNVHPDSLIGRFTKIGEGTRINGPCIISSKANAPVTIGKYCAIGYNLKIRVKNHHTCYVNQQDNFQNNHKFPSLDKQSPITIGHNVWIGDNVTILSGVTVGNGAVLGAGAVVTRDIEPYGIAVGVPASIIKYRFSDKIIKQLQRIEWWNWSEAKIERNRNFFETDFSKNPNLIIGDY